MSNELRIDHATIAGPELAPMQEAFGRIGLKTEYGGVHANGVTHMALLGFDDGSYIELISVLRPGETDIPIWKGHILGEGGPCAWAVRCDDVNVEASRVSGLGVPVQGPYPEGRKTPAGVDVRWRFAFLGDQPAGAALPFVIQDVTPREYRVKVSPSVAGSELVGVEIVVIGVNHLEAKVTLFRRLYHWCRPQTSSDDGLGARLVYFPGTPVMLASPIAPGSWLATRLARFGESPCAFLIRTKDFRLSSKRSGLTPTSALFERRVAWMDPGLLNGARLGLVE